MGVKGIWELLESVGRPLTLEALENKTLGVDVSLLLNQSVKGMRGKHGNPLATAHLVGLFNSVTKLLSHRIKPIFVFDGRAPDLKDKTLAARKDQRFKAVHKSKRAAEKMLKNKLKVKGIKAVTEKESTTPAVMSKSTKDHDVHAFELPPLLSSAVTDVKRPSQRKAEAKTRIFPQSFSHGNTGVPVIKKKYPLEESRNGMDCIVEPKAGPSGLSLEGHVATEVKKEELDKISAEQKLLLAEHARQNRRAATVSPDMYTDCQKLLQLFGVPYVVSPKEAEAQCAALELVGITEGSITDDSDIFLFGSKRVYRNIFNPKVKAEEYGSDAVKRKLALGRSSLICIALITGSDYTDGLRGFGAVGGMEILHEFSIEDFEGLNKFRSWHEEAQKHPKNPHEARIRTRLRSVVLPCDFPSADVYEAYLNPVVEEPTEQFEWRKPDLDSLRWFASNILGWSQSKTDKVLEPLIKRLAEKKTQTKIKKYFNQLTEYRDKKQVKSKRIQRVLHPPCNRFSRSKSDNKERDKTNKKQKQHTDKMSEKMTNKTQLQDKKRPCSTDTNTSNEEHDVGVSQPKLAKKEWWR